jgi:hypothetical protein
MSKYAPSAIQQSDLDTAQAPYLGGEFAVYLSRTPSYDVGNVTLSSSGTGNAANATWTPNTAVTLPPGGTDLQMVATSALSSPSGPLTVVLNVVNDLGNNATLTFIFQPPARAEDQSFDFSRGYATDGELSAGNYTKTITGLQSVTNGDINVSLDIYQLPLLSSYTLVGCTTEKKFSTKSRKPVGIDCGMESDAFIKRGKSGKGELTIDSKFKGMHANLTRFDGAKCTALLVGIKDGVITTDQMVFTQFVPGVEIHMPDGDGEAMENAATGKYKEALFFVAP